MADLAENETRLRGLPVSPGVAVAKVCLFRDSGRHANVPHQRVSGEAVAQEKERLERALAIVIGRLEALEKVTASRIGSAEAEIFLAQRMMAQDQQLVGRIVEAVDGGDNAETAAMKVLDSYESQLAAVDHDYLKERASDIGELKHRLLDALLNTAPSFLCETEPHCQRGRNRIIVTEELTPAVSLQIDTHEVRGIVTARGGTTSHAAILARATGIPAVSGIPDAPKRVSCGTVVLVNGDTGEVVVWPSPETVADAKAQARRRADAVAAPVEGLVVMANISLASEVGDAVAAQAEGVGLYRTEFEFFAAGRLLSEDEQAERYAAVVETMRGWPVYFRLLDIGGDKPSPLFETGREENPSLGCRGARYLLSRPDLLKTQARALVRASEGGTVHVMYPMVVGLSQFHEMRQVFDEATADLAKGDLRHGVMFEVPSACLEAEDLLGAADFGSIGSNDLVQYLFAVDRGNERVAHDYSPDRKVFWHLLEDLGATAERAGKPLSLCGELAADPTHTARLLALGIRSVSVSARHIPAVRRAAQTAVARSLP